MVIYYLSGEICPIQKIEEEIRMKRKVISILAAITLMASASVVPSTFAMSSGSLASDQPSMSTSSPRGTYDLSQLIGKDVKGIQGNTIGTVKNFVGDPNGNVFAVISDKETGKNIAVPSEAFSSIGQDKTLNLNLTRDQLAQAPQFDRAFMSNPGWSTELYRQYGIQPSFSGQGKSGMSQQPSDRPMQPPGQQQQRSPYSGQPGSRSY